jgi:hypothetical protein
MRDLLFDFGTWLRHKAYPSPKIEFYTDIAGLEEFAPITSAAKNMPNWYRDLPKIHAPNSQRQVGVHNEKLLPTGNPVEWRTTGETVKTCPGLQDIMTTGYIVPFWGAALVEVSHDGESAASITSSINATHYDGSTADFVKTSASDGAYKEWCQYVQGLGITEKQLVDWNNLQARMKNKWEIGTHPKHQYSNMVSQLPEGYASTVMKIVSPWRIKTPKNFSTMVMPPAYNWNDAYEVLPGIINTDYYRLFNVFIVPRQKGIKFQIQFRDPIAQWFIFPKYQLPYEVRKQTVEDEHEQRVAVNAIHTGWGSSKGYRMMGRLRKGGRCPYKP